ncbi:hypothetical protein NMG60_11018558 [Bertholletia excelsa]
MDRLELSPMLTVAWFFLLLNSTKHFLSARTLDDPSPTSAPHHHIPLSLSFYMLDVLTEAHLSPRPTTSEFNGEQVPFAKPLGLFPSQPMPNAGQAAAGESTQTLDLPGMGFAFPTRATLQELEFGVVTTIDEALFKDSFGVVMVGKGQGMYVASSKHGASLMIAMRASFTGGESQDGLRLFGVHRRDLLESHVAVIGGTGKYENANGYAEIRTVNVSSSEREKTSERSYRVLLFNVYLG